MNNLSSSIVDLSLWVLALFSIASWTVILVKIWIYTRLARQDREFHRWFWQARDVADAEDLAQRAKGNSAELARRGFAVLRAANDGALERSGSRRVRLERAMRDGLQARQRSLESGLMLLAGVGATAPFVGLFGTVWGIMDALKSIGVSGSAGLDVVAGPIGEALVATAFGIAAAVPAVLAYNYGLRRAKLLVAEMENFAMDFIELLAEE